MRKPVYLFLAACGVFSSGVAWADTSSAPPGDQVASDGPDEMICRKVEELGTRLGGRKVCHTAKEWQQIERDAQDEVGDIQRRGSMGPSGG